MKEKASTIRDIVYPCPKCSRISLVRVSTDLYQCIECDLPQEEAPGTSNNLVACVLGCIGWFLLLFLL